MSQPHAAELEIPNVERSVAEALHLVRFAQRNGVPIRSKLLTLIVNAGQLLKKGELTGDNLVNFHCGYHELACSLLPVTVKGILDCVDEFGSPKRKWVYWGKWVRYSQASVIVRRYQLIALIVLSLLVAVHSYWLIGDRLIRSLRELDPKPASTQPAQGSTPERASLPKLLDADDETKKDLRAIRFELLKTWILFPRVSGLKEDSPVAEYYAVRHSGEDRLQILQQMILPLLYGSLGALVYVMRQLSDDVTHRVFRAESRVQYQLRVMLGALAGLAVGWFANGWANSERSILGTGNVAGLEPAAIAFLAGYSVEFFFSAMDHLVSTFAATSQPGRAKARP